MGRGRRKSRQPSPPECSVLSKLYGANPWPPAPLSGPWILEGAGHAFSPRISGRVPSWSQARTGPGSFSRLTPTPPTCFRPFCPHPSPQCLPHKKRQAGRRGGGPAGKLPSPHCQLSIISPIAFTEATLCACQGPCLLLSVSRLSEQSNLQPRFSRAKKG